MSDYTVSRISPTDKRAVRQMDALLEKEGIERDKNLDYSIGLFDDDYNLVATGSCFANTLRCMAVSSEHQGEGLMNQVISHLIEYQYSRGNTSLFLYTKCNTARFFSDLSFYEIARVEGKVVFMENRRSGFADYLKQLQQETAAFLAAQTAPVVLTQTENQDTHNDKDGTDASVPTSAQKIGAVIMNANPFTLGHRYLVEQAAASVDLLHVFVVSEDASLVPFSIRRQLVADGCADLSNVICHETGPYMISNATFPSYFLKDSDTVIRSHAKLDIQVFLRIASALSITDRFVGEEPFSQVTGIYNQVMAEELSAAGLTCNIIPRKADADGAISASDVRCLIKDGDFEALKKKVPACTFQYFTSAAAEPVIQKIRAAAEVRHY